MSNSLQRKMLWGGGKLLSAILVFLLIIAVSACQNDAPKAADLRIHIVDGISSSKTVMPDGFRGVDRYELVIADESGTEVAKSTATGSVDAVVSGIVPGQYTITVKGYADIGGQPVLIIDDSQPLTVKEGMSEVSVAVSDIAEGMGTVDLTITADMPEGYTFADDRVTVRLYDGREAVYTATIGYTAADGVMTARLEDDIGAGVYTVEAQVDELYGRATLYVLPGMTSTGSVTVNPMIAEKVATPVISEVEANPSNLSEGLQSKQGDVAVLGEFSVGYGDIFYYNEFSGEVEIGVFELDGNSTYIMNGLWSDSDDCELLDSDLNLIEALPGTGGFYLASANGQPANLTTANQTYISEIVGGGLWRGTTTRINGETLTKN